VITGCAAAVRKLFPVLPRDDDGVRSAGSAVVVTVRASPAPLMGKKFPMLAAWDRAIDDEAFIATQNSRHVLPVTGDGSGTPDDTVARRRAINVTGIVQGVGFRPFVHGLARDLGLGGFVRNWAGGALIEVEGDLDALDRFVSTLGGGRPPGARVDGLRAMSCATRGEREFRIVESECATPGRVAVSPDLATCDDCLRELFDRSDRRYRYPFITCAHCGPRLTIMTAAPYDRQRTTMTSFPMCRACRADYDDPGNRRFHAQAIACPACGPRLRAVERRTAAPSAVDPLTACVEVVRAGGIVAVKGLGGYHLVCDAGGPGAAVAELRRRKARDEKPFAIMVADDVAAEAVCELSASERRALTSTARPIVLLRRRPGAAIADAVAPGTTLLGVMLPYTPLHHLLLHEMRGRAVVMTSGNRSDEPIIADDDEAVERLTAVADLVLAHDRPIHVRGDDSVLRVHGRAVLPVRRARGLAPASVALPARLARPTLALGGHLKAVIALGEADRALPSHHLGDLDGYETYRAYVAAIEHYERLFRIETARLVHDLHPDYASTRYAIERARDTGVERLAVQHHHAHMASCMAEHGLAEPVIGVCFDGAGWGTDGTVWGGEFLLGDARVARRVAHLRPVPLPGGEAAMREPWRMAVAHLREAGAPIGRSCIPERVDPVRLRAVEAILERGRAPSTSSIGRLFDAVAALVGLGDRMSYEGQAAMRLESLATEAVPDGEYPVDLLPGPTALVVDPRPLIQAIVADARRGAASSVIARRFHSAIAEAVDAVCRRLRDATAVSTVVLSGGVFLNALLADDVTERLTRAGFRAHRHRIMPPNDGGLCLGQLAIAAAHDAAAHAGAA
jgi:hydrogenase maturation protein HypF